MMAASNSESFGRSYGDLGRQCRSLHSSRKPMRSRISRYSFMYLPACRISHTGV